jgi:hypothetical protein
MPPFKGQGEHQNPLAFRLAASAAGDHPMFPRAKRPQSMNKERGWLRRTLTGRAVCSCPVASRRLGSDPHWISAKKEENPYGTGESGVLNSSRKELFLKRIPENLASHPPQRTMEVSSAMTNHAPEQRPHTIGFTTSSMLWKGSLKRGT